MPQYGWYVGNSKDFSGMNIWNMSIYVHLCCSMGFFDNSKDFSGMKFWKTYIYVHLCCSMVDIVIIQKILVGWNLKHVHVFPFMLQYGWHFHNSKQIRKKHLPELKKYSTYMSGIFYVHVFFNSWRYPKTYFFQFYILCTGIILYIHINESCSQIGQ